MRVLHKHIYIRERAVTQRKTHIDLKKRRYKKKKNHNRTHKPIRTSNLSTRFHLSQNQLTGCRKIFSFPSLYTPKPTSHQMPTQTPKHFHLYCHRRVVNNPIPASARCASCCRSTTVKFRCRCWFANCASLVISAAAVSALLSAKVEAVTAAAISFRRLVYDVDDICKDKARIHRVSTGNPSTKFY